MKTLGAPMVLLLLSTGGCAGRQSSGPPACSELWPMDAATERVRADSDARPGRSPAWSTGDAASAYADDGAPHASQDSDSSTQAPAAPQPSAAPEAPQNAEERVRHLQSLLAELRTSHWGSTCNMASASLAAMGAALPDLRTDDDALKRRAREVDAEAQAVASACGQSFEAAEHMQKGLRHVLEAVQGQDEVQVRRLEPWLLAAREAVDDLEPRSPSSLQRAVLQDALRTVSDALLIAATWQPATAQPSAR